MTKCREGQSKADLCAVFLGSGGVWEKDGGASTWEIRARGRQLAGEEGMVGGQNFRRRARRSPRASAWRIE